MNILVKNNKKKLLKITAFNQGEPYLKSVQINLNLGKIPFVRCINRISPSVVKFET